jgi:hypothetical protein
MVDDVTQKLVTAIRNLQHDVRRMLSGRWLENASVRGGRLRFIGGILRLDSGALLDLIGQWRLRGPGAITGDVFSEGKWTQVGDYDFTGEGDLAGNVTMSGDFDLTGMFKSGNVRIEDGKIHVGAGASEIIIDGADGSVTAGNVKIKDGKIIVGAGASQVVIDGVTGKILAGNMAINPANGGLVEFPGGASVKAGTGGGVSVVAGSYLAVITSAGASVGKSGLNLSVTDGVGFQFVGLPTITTTASGLPAGSMYVTPTNQPRRVIVG